MTDTVETSLGASSGLGVSVVLLRGAATLPAQAARLVRGGASTAAGEGTESAQASPMLCGAPDMNIRARDRFTVAELTYEVVAVLPQRQVATWAQVRSLQ
jgi:hypothetical protein